MTVALVYGSPVGEGGLGIHAASLLCSLADHRHTLHAYGPGLAPAWPFEQPPPDVLWHNYTFKAVIPLRYTPYRWLQGRLRYKSDKALGDWAAREIIRLQPSCCYLFTQVALETLRWARATAIPTVLDSPNGHIAGYHEVCCEESRRWCGSRYLGHPSSMMVKRMEEEYQLADRIRVSSEWAKRSLVERGVSADKITVIPLVINLKRFGPPVGYPKPDGPLRLCCVGSLDLRKGFVYLLKALQTLPRGQVRLTIVGATGSHSCKKLFERGSAGLDISCAPGDPLPVMQSSELFILPSLEDGFGLAIGEAMACGLPAIVTDQCGAQEMVEDGVSGWVVPARDSAAIANVLRLALDKRNDLREMGRSARASAAQFLDWSNTHRLHDWFFSILNNRQTSESVVESGTNN